MPASTACYSLSSNKDDPANRNTLPPPPPSSKTTCENTPLTLNKEKTLKYTPPKGCRSTPLLLAKVVFNINRLLE